MRGLSVFLCAAWAIVAGAATGKMPVAPGIGSATGKMPVAPGKYELLLQKFLPQEKLNKVAGFFGPVTKKYLPTVNKFQDEYLKAPKKREVIVKYLPQAEAALADAKAMKVPARFEKEKQDYLLMAQTFLTVVKFSTTMNK